jgi:hypothetical protein
MKDERATYKCWFNMKQRCNDKKHGDYKNYGGRGITYDPRWEQFECFYLDMGEKPVFLSLDRVNNDGNYNKGNCRWASPHTQMNNTRKNRFIIYKGENITVAEASRRSGIKYQTLISRLHRNTTEEELFAELLKPTSARYGLDRIMKSHTNTEKSG